ncbi:hypothetical protein J5X84_00395 [Streptosporangiaceae bacterium NEAU-GS5]|nr:hypothetical protein [Streptosporangiaceae bacterium NEAU-GS5]
MPGKADLIGQSVWDSRGIWVGQIVDVTMIKNGEESTAVTGLVVSATRAPMLLGFSRDPDGHLTRVGEWVSRILYKGSRVVPWDVIETADTGEVVLKEPRSSLRRH